MGEVQDHYNNLLAKHYTWMFGTPFDEKVSEQKEILEEALQTNADCSGLAVDLGSGPGFQAIALSEMGFSPVLAVDTNEFLLNELQSHQGHRPVRTVCSDLLRLREFVAPMTAQVIVCMGDTITHLPNKDAVEELILLVADTLAPDGKFVITYRDLSVEATGLDRFIPVHADQEKVMTCFLEFDRPDSVLVYDLVYSREGSKWLLEKSAYRKLRLPADWLQDAMKRAGFIVHTGQAGRFIRLVGQKRDAL
ncbi:MAG TPA: class I SAM-dependent methyltransferase [Acidobacteriaceae bacterium]|nr:class I SAM-dependent methyltransferase [Acidobacteriaceae bacterium]